MDERYIIFRYAQYYPSGGLGDKHSSHDDLEQAVIIAKSVTEDGWEYVEIYDRLKGKEVDYE